MDPINTNTMHRTWYSELSFKTTHAASALVVTTKECGIKVYQFGEHFYTNHQETLDHAAQIALSVRDFAIKAFKVFAHIAFFLMGSSTYVVGVISAIAAPEPFRTAATRFENTFWNNRSGIERTALVFASLFFGSVLPYVQTACSFFCGVSLALHYYDMDKNSSTTVASTQTGTPQPPPQNPPESPRTHSPRDFDQIITNITHEFLPDSPKISPKPLDHPPEKKNEPKEVQQEPQPEPQPEPLKEPYLAPKALPTSTPLLTQETTPLPKPKKKRKKPMNVVGF